MIFLPAVLARLDIIAEYTTQYSFVCIATTNPVYLVFKEGCNTPDFVIKALTSEQAFAAWETQQQLYKLVPALIAEPLQIVDELGSYYSIEKGATGFPWFQVKQRFSGRAWQKLQSDAIQCLCELHQAIALNSQWQKYLAPVEILAEIFEDYCAVEGAVSEQLQHFYKIQSSLLASVSAIQCTKQHGDFCLNNLLLGEDQLTVIDFEDFGITMLPLFDEFNLALSLLSNNSNRGEISNLIKQCTDSALARYQIEPALLPAFFLGYLLLKLGKWSLPGKRQAHRGWLQRLLADFLAHPTEYFGTAGNRL